MAPLALLLALAAPATPAPSVDELLRDAQARAAREGKHVLVSFGASWCPWCRRFDALMEHDKFKQAFSDSYVPVKIRIRERGAWIPYENPGWQTWLPRLRGNDQKGIPFVVVLDGENRPIGAPLALGGQKVPDVGYPAEKPEIELWLGVIRRTGKGFDASTRYELGRYLLQGPPPAPPAPPAPVSSTGAPL